MNDNGNLAAAVAALEMVTANGDVVVLSRDQDGETFQGAVVGLGGLGVVTNMTLDIIPMFAMQQEVYENLPVAQLEEHFDAIVSSAYSVSLFTDWAKGAGEPGLVEAPPRRRTCARSGTHFLRGDPGKKQRHPIDSLSGDPCTPQMGFPARGMSACRTSAWTKRQAAARSCRPSTLCPASTPSRHLRAITELHEQIAPFLMISEVRTIAADTLWISPCYQQDRVALHFTWKLNWPEVQKLFPPIEAQLAPFNARPHWGKLFTMPPAQLQSLYAKLPDFQQLLRSYDPQGKFRNAFLDTYIFG